MHYPPPHTPSRTIILLEFCFTRNRMCTSTLFSRQLNDLNRTSGFLLYFNIRDLENYNHNNNNKSIRYDIRKGRYFDKTQSHY